MKFDDIYTDVLERVLAQMPHRFHTRDISEDPEMQRAHGFDPTTPDRNAYRNYHAIIGRFLSANRDYFRLRQTSDTDDSGRKNAGWEKL